MIIKPSSPDGYTLFCDDIRHEVTGKTTLVGIYNSQLIITGNLPVILPKLCASITLRLNPPLHPLKPVIKVFRTDQDEPIFVCEVDIPAVDPEKIPQVNQHLEPDAVTFIQFSVNAQFESFQIEKPCALKVRVFIGNDELRLGALQIIHTSPDSIETVGADIHALASGEQA
ncbi:MAG: hypothetical protein ACKVOS_03945 [Sphingorhabdus sp.]|uniref:hypothetical protein n=1 Tax=Sphingorhabdus sp. TaxID=1902408 RepID=UPI0038FC6E80